MAFCKKFMPKIRKALNKIGDFAEAHIDAALKITGGIKKALSSDEAVLLTNLIPGKWDDKIREGALIGLDKVFAGLVVFDSCMELPTREERLACFIDQLKRLPAGVQEAILVKSASTIFASIHEAHGNSPEPQHVNDTVVQVKYSLNKPEPAEA